MTKNTKNLNWKGIKSYLDSIEMISEVDIDLVEEIYFQGRIICPEPLKTIFISNYEEPNGKDQFKDLWLFSEKYVIEILNFNKQDTFKYDMTIYKKNIENITIDESNYDLSKKADTTSRLHIIFYTFGQFTCEMISQGINCDYLFSLYKTYLIPNLLAPYLSG